CVTLFEADADDAARLGAAILFERRLLDQAAAGGHEQMMLGVKAADRNYAGDFLVFLKRQDVGDRAAYAGAAHLRDVVDLKPVELAAVGEAEQVGMRGGDEEVLDKVVLAGAAARDALAAAVLAAVGVQGEPLD